MPNSRLSCFQGTSTNGSIIHFSRIIVPKFFVESPWMAFLSLKFFKRIVLIIVVIFFVTRRTAVVVRVFELLSRRRSLIIRVMVMPMAVMSLQFDFSRRELKRSPSCSGSFISTQKFGFKSMMQIQETRSCSHSSFTSFSWTIKGFTRKTSGPRNGFGKELFSIKSFNDRT